MWWLLHSALMIFGEMVNPCSCSVKIRSSWLYYFNAPYFQGCVPLGESGSGFLICGVPFKQIHFQISDPSNFQITDPTRSFRRRIRNQSFCPAVLNFKQANPFQISDPSNFQITDPTRSFRRRIRNQSFCPAVLNFKQVGTSYIDRKDCWQSLHKFCDKHKIKSSL